MTIKKAQLALQYLKETHQFFCFISPETFYSAEELLQIVKGRPVSFYEAIDYVTK